MLILKLANSISQIIGIEVILSQFLMLILLLLHFDVRGDVRGGMMLRWFMRRLCLYWMRMMLGNMVEDPWSPTAIAAWTTISEMLLFLHSIPLGQTKIGSRTFRLMPLQMSFMHRFKAISAHLRLRVFLSAFAALNDLHLKYIKQKIFKSFDQNVEIVFFIHVELILAIKYPV